ncbi:hypothetical protein [Actinomyces gaoshouyii]|uniref:Uncharacterized protein n=1 Tax=Actinomyces gaoshouyii TaxID=1960083 RepID=A0A8H9LEJ9_9ACTO|nr:hypothetical protein [Actinomyces gaoshouyii]GGO96683.1 hypothetical protein GCM10011612_07480 [Actinomyces gaoshouyii]
MSAPDGAGRPTARTSEAAFRAAGRRVGVIGTALAAACLAAGAAGGGRALAGAAWGAGAGLALTVITAVALLVPWQRFPLMASAGVMLSFAAKIAVMAAVVLLAGPHREGLSRPWFLASLALILIVVTIVEVVTLARGRALTIEIAGITGNAEITGVSECAEGADPAAPRSDGAGDRP